MNCGQPFESRQTISPSRTAFLFIDDPIDHARMENEAKVDRCGRPQRRIVLTLTLVFGIGQNVWSPDGTRIVFPQIDAAGISLITLELTGGPALTVFTASEMKGINSFLWLADGRLVYSLPEPGAIASIANLWIVRLDERGKSLEKPSRTLPAIPPCRIVAVRPKNGNPLEIGKLRSV